MSKAQYFFVDVKAVGDLMGRFKRMDWLSGGEIVPKGWSLRTGCPSF